MTLGWRGMAFGFVEERRGRTGFYMVSSEV
jgi:hypothetical protein